MKEMEEMGRWQMERDEKIKKDGKVVLKAQIMSVCVCLGPSLMVSLSEEVVDRHDEKI